MHEHKIGKAMWYSSSITAKRQAENEYLNKKYIYVFSCWTSGGRRGRGEGEGGVGLGLCRAGAGPKKSRDMSTV